MYARHHDYYLPLPTIPVNGLQGVQLLLDNDAPFALRNVRKWQRLGVPGVGSVPWRFKLPTGMDQSSDFRFPFDGFGDGLVIRPNAIYPPNGAIVVDVNNTLGAPITGASLLFRGCKLYRDGVVAAPTYPAHCSLLPMAYEVPVMLQPTDTVRNIQLAVRSNADFVVRSMVARPFTLLVDGQPVPPAALVGYYSNLLIQLKDQDQRPYSNLPIPIDNLVGNSAGLSGWPSVTEPGLLVSEIYVPRSKALYFDLFRTDLGEAGGRPINLRVQFQGVGVFQR